MIHLASDLCLLGLGFYLGYGYNLAEQTGEDYFIAKVLVTTCWLPIAIYTKH